MIIRGDGELTDAASELLDMLDLADELGRELSSMDREFVRFLNRIRVESGGHLMLTPRWVNRLRRLRRRVETDGYPYVRNIYFT